MSKKKYGSDLIIDVIKQYDFDYVSFNPGSSFRALHDSLVHHGGNAKPEVILCPHENTALRWRPQDQRFQCPRHQSKYRPDGTFISGRPTRNMDRFALHLSDGKVIVDLSKLFRSDRQKNEWDAAVLAL